MCELETYQKLNILNALINEVKCRGRPPKWFKNLITYLHENDIIHQFEGDNIYSNIDTIKRYINSTDAGRLSNIFYGANFSAYGQFLG